MDNKATTKRMIGAVVLVLVAALLLAWLLKGKNRNHQQQDLALNQSATSAPIIGLSDTAQKPQLVNDDPNAALNAPQQPGVAAVDAIQQQQQAAQQPAAGGSGFLGGLFSAGKSVAPDAGQEVKMPAGNATQQTASKTDLSVRPPEVRDIVDIDGRVKDGSGSMGTSGAVPKSMAEAGKTSSDAPQATSTASQAGANNASHGGATANQAGNVASSKPAVSSRDVAEEKKTAASNKLVLVNEKPVPRVSPSAEEARAKAAAARDAAAKEAAMREAAADKAAAAKVAAEKAAADAKVKAVAANGTAAGGASSGEASAGSTGKFSVQVMASSDKAKADAMAAPLKADGYNVVVVQAQSAGKTVYRVNVIGFADRAAAEAAQAKMKSRYKQNAAIQGSFVTGG